MKKTLPLHLQIRAHRESLSLTQQQAADRCGMLRPHWVRLETGKHPPSLATREKIAAGLGCRFVESIELVPV